MKPILKGMNFLVGFAVGDRPNEGAPSQPEAHAKPPAGVESAVHSASAAPSPKPGRSDRAYDVFVSYRRDKGSEVARYVAERLAKRGYRVFLDVD